MNNSDNIPAGTIVKVKRSYGYGIFSKSYDHYGVVMDSNKICDVSGGIDIGMSGVKGPGRIGYTEFEAFRGQGNVEIVYLPSTDPLSENHSDVILNRARSKIGPIEYNLIKYNCEHFARWCFNGVESSEQVSAALGWVTIPSIFSRHKRNLDIEMESNKKSKLEITYEETTHVSLNDMKRESIRLCIELEKNISDEMDYLPILHKKLDTDTCEERDRSEKRMIELRREIEREIIASNNRRLELELNLRRDHASIENRMRDMKQKLYEEQKRISQLDIEIEMNEKKIEEKKTLDRIQRILEGEIVVNSMNREIEHQVKNAEKYIDTDKRQYVSIIERIDILRDELKIKQEEVSKL